MKKLRNVYFILGLFAIVFAILTRVIPAFNSGSPLFDFANGFCWGLGVTSLISGLITSVIPYFYRRDKKKADQAQVAGTDIAAAPDPAAIDTAASSTDAATVAAASDGTASGSTV